MKKIYLFAFAFFLGTMKLFSQYNTISESTNREVQNHYMTSVHVGTVGFGLDFKFNHGIHTARLGYSMIPFHYATVVDMGIQLGANAKISYNNLHLLYDIQPFNKATWFRFTSGLAYFNSAKIVANLTPKEALETNVVSLTVEEIGGIELTVDSKGISPYLGISLGRALPKKRFNLNFDLGTFYLPSPKVTVVGTKLLKNNEDLGARLTEDLKTYRWMPMLQLNFTYLIK
jgi:hypothetical protein